MKKYIAPTLEIRDFQKEDVLCASGVKRAIEYVGDEKNGYNGGYVTGIFSFK